MDSHASGRVAYIETLKAMAHHYRKRPFGWVWAAAGSQPSLESAVGVGGFGYPALTALNSRKKRYSTSALAFSEAGIKDFINTLVWPPLCFVVVLTVQVAGKHATAPLNGEVGELVNEHAPWDGKDAVVEAVEEIDLSDLEDL